MSNPFLPAQRGDIAVLDGRASGDVERSLEKLGFEVIRTIGCRELYDAISYHPDIVLHPIEGRDIVVAKNVFDYYDSLLRPYGFNLVASDKMLGEKYPDNICLNIGRVSNCAIHNKKHTDGQALRLFQSSGIELIETKQGYGKCSTLTIGEKSLITTDMGIKKRLDKDTDIEAYFVDPEGIKLEGMDYGFIGGCGNMISERELVLSGRYDHMKDREYLDSIFREKNIEVIYLSDDKISDIGGIIFLEKNTI